MIGVLALAVCAGGAVAQTSTSSADRATYVEMVRRAAIERGVPPDLAEAVAQIESGYDPRAVGTVGEVGLMQVRPETAAMLGFRGLPADLAQPQENVRYGVAYLAGAWRLANGQLCQALMKYRAGHGSEVMSPLSATYCQRARTYLSALGSPLASGAGPVLPSPTPVGLATRTAVPRLPSCKRGTEACSRLFWAAHEARIRRMVAQLHGGRRPRG